MKTNVFHNEFTLIHKTHGNIFNNKKLKGKNVFCCV